MMGFFFLQIVKKIHKLWNVLPTPLKTIFTICEKFVSHFVKTVLGLISQIVKKIHKLWNYLPNPLKTIFTICKKFSSQFVKTFLGLFSQVVKKFHKLWNYLLNPLKTIFTICKKFSSQFVKIPFTNCEMALYNHFFRYIDWAIIFYGPFLEIVSFQISLMNSYLE